MIRVLYVDDNANFLDLVTKFLERSGTFIVTTVTNAPEALRLLELAKFDAIVSDYQMPEMDGIRFLTVVRARGDKTPFIVFTAKGREDVVVEALNAGADFYVHKGSDTEAQYAELANKIQHAVSLRQADTALIDAEKRYRVVFENTGSATVIIEEDTIISLANAGFERLSGYTKEELEGKKSWTEFVAKEDLVRMQRQHKLRRVERDKALRHYEFRFITRTGDIRDIFLYIDLIPGTKKSVASLIDITDRKQVERTLEESERQFRALSENSQDYIMRYDREHRHTYANPACLRIAGMTKEQFIGKTHRELGFPPDLCALWEPAIERVFATGQSFSEIFRWASGEGDVFLDWRLFPEKDAEGTVVSVLGVSRDITELKKAEETIRESEERFRHISDLIPDFAYSCRKAPEGVFAIDWITGAPENITGYNAGEITMMTCWKFLVVDEDILVFEKNVTGLLPGESARCELRIRRKDGGITWLSSYARCVADKKEPGYLSLFGACQDITERKRAEEALKESQERFLQITESAGEWIWEVDADGMYTYSNGTVYDILGYTPEEFVRKRHFYDFFVPEDRDRLKENAFRAFANHEPFKGFVNVNLHKNGNRVILETSGYPVLDATGNITGYRGADTDITVRTQAEEAVQAIQEKYTKAFLLAPDAITVSEMDTGRFIEVNDAATRLFGYSREELLGKSAVELGILLNAADRTRLIDQVRNHGRVSRFELIERRKSGELYTALVSADTVTIGNITYLITTIRDITERKQAEEALRESEERYSSIFDNNYSVSLLIDPDTGDIVEANTAAVRYYGYAHEALTSMGIYDLNRLPKEKVIRDLQRAKDEKAKHFFSTHYLANGEKRTVEIYSGPITLRGKPLFYSIIHDITERTKAQEALKQKESELHDILEGSPIPNFVIDRDHRVISWNKALEEATGFAAANMLGTTRHWQAFYAVERPCLADLLVDGKTETIREWYAEKIDAVRLAGGIFDGTDFFPHLGTDGKWLHFSASAIQDGAGTIIGAVETLQDITRQKRAEEEIRTLQQFQQSIIDNANVWISVLDPKSNILVWNTTAEQITGYTADEVMGKNTIWKQLYPDPVYRKGVADNILEIIRKNTFVENFETRIRTKSGKEKIIWWNTQPLRDASGKPVRFITIGRDNTERRRSEEKLRSLRQFEESVIKNANIWISVLDKKGTVSVWNRAAEEISGYTADEVIGNNTIWRLMYPDTEYRRTVTAKIQEVIGAHQYLENFETRIRTKNGKEKIIWWNTRALQDVPGIGETFIAIGRDVTEQKTLSDAVTLANKKLNLLSSITRHDILNQLMALKGYLELSQDIIDVPATLKEYITKEQTIANTIQMQIQFTKDYESMGINAPVWQNVQERVEKAKQGLLLQETAIETDLPAVDVFADPLLERVFFNLIDNAIRYGGDQMKTIRISSQERDHGLVIVCEDDGVGIPADKKEAIFMKGYFKHTGLGLFLSREILGITGITIAENGEPGKGARFEITVPKGMWRMMGAHE